MNVDAWLEQCYLDMESTPFPDPEKTLINWLRNDSAMKSFLENRTIYMYYGILTYEVACLFRISSQMEISPGLSFTDEILSLIYYTNSCKGCACYNDYLTTGWCKVRKGIEKKIYEFLK